MVPSAACSDQPTRADSPHVQCTGGGEVVHHLRERVLSRSNTTSRRSSRQCRLTVRLPLPKRPKVVGNTVPSLSVEVIGRVCPAPRVERSCTLRARVRAPVRLDRQLCPAHPAENGGAIPLLSWPLPSRVIGGFAVAEMARIVAIAAGEANGDDIEHGRIVLTSSVLIDCFAEDGRTLGHRAPVLRCWGPCVVQTSRRLDSSGRESMEETPSR